MEEISSVQWWSVVKRISDFCFTSLGVTTYPRLNRDRSVNSELFNILGRIYSARHLLAFFSRF